MRRYTWRLAVLAALLIVAGCGEKEQPTTQQKSTAEYLPGKVAEANVERTGEVRVFVGDSLWEYIDGGAELYHAYNFVEVATSYYAYDGMELVADIYRFDTPDNAFGLYSALRPPDAEIIGCGVEGFGSESSLDFVKGVYLVRFVAYDQAEQTAAAIKALAEAIEADLPGTSSLPEGFKLLPDSAAIMHTERIFSAFLSQSFLTSMYTRDYDLDGDTVQVFISVDRDGEQYAQWQRAAEGETADGLGFDEGSGNILDDLYYGHIVFGKKGEYLVGMVNYGEQHNAFLNAWLSTLP